MTSSTTLATKEAAQKENRAWVRITAACNNKCIFCLDENAQDGTLVDEEVVKKNIDAWYVQGSYNRIIISGGEASINPKFPEYISYAKSIWYDRIQTVTNGNMFAIESFCHKVFTAGLQEVTFSFHGHTPALHDYLVDVPWAFKKSLKGIIYVKKYFPDVIVNVDVVVNKVNVRFLPDIVKFFMRLDVYEFDLLHIIPFGRWFEAYKNILFYDVADYIKPLHDTWELSKIPWMYMWTNRFPVEAFEWYEELIQDPKKIAAEVWFEWYEMYSQFINTSWKKKPSCYGESCEHCFIHQYCHDFLNHRKQTISQELVVSIEPKIHDYSNTEKQYISLQWELYMSDVMKKYGESKQIFLDYISTMQLAPNQELLNIPVCIRQENNTWRYQRYPDLKSKEDNADEYTDEYIKNLYRKKSLQCRKCKHYNRCEGIHINFIRAYGFDILKPIFPKKK